jgi:hypothetical protein
MSQHASSTHHHEAPGHSFRIGARVRTTAGACLVALGWIAGCGGATSMGDGRSNASAGDGGAKEQADSGGTVKTVDPRNPRCGDGRLGPGELCDGLEFPTTDCNLLSMGAVKGGKLHCTAQCSITFVAANDPLPGVLCDGTAAPPHDAGSSCAPQFCPTMGAGAGCCMSSAGPCGVDYGMGCVAPARDGGTAAPACGNGRIDDQEVCDGDALPSTNCALLSMGTRTTGKLRCTSDCRLEFLDCSDPTPGVACEGTTCATP